MESAAGLRSAQRRKIVWISVVAGFLIVATPFLPIPLTVSSSVACAQGSDSTCDSSQGLQWIPLYEFVFGRP